MIKGKKWNEIISELFSTVAFGKNFPIRLNAVQSKSDVDANLLNLQFRFTLAIKRQFFVGFFLRILQLKQPNIES